MLKYVVTLCYCLMSNLILFAQDSGFDTDRLPIGNPLTRYDFFAVKLDGIYNTNDRQEFSMDQFIGQLQNFRIILIGESHTSDLHHQMQLSIIRGLTESGKRVCLALEMFNPTQNAVLNDYISGKLTEDEFLDRSDYFNTWGHNYRYYKPIFDYAREKNIRMYGVNIEREYASRIGRGGLNTLSADELSKIPAIDTTDVEHRFFVKVAMEGIDATSPAQFKKIYAAQCLWDAVMGEGAIRAAMENPESIVVLLAGSGHVAYNFSIGKIIKKRSDFSFASILSVDVPDSVKESVMMKVKKSIKKDEPARKDDKESGQKMPGMQHMMSAMDTTPHKIVIRSLADYLCGVKEEQKEKYPSFGFSVNERSDKGFEIKQVIPETMAEREGLHKGDVILSIDGHDFKNMAKLKQYLSFVNWGDTISFQMQRDGTDMQINFEIQDKKSH